MKRSRGGAGGQESHFEQPDDSFDTAGHTSRPKLLSRALKLLSLRPRSERELQSLLGPHADNEQIIDCLSRLKELGYINDRRLAENYASHRLSVRPMGRSRLARELVEKKISREVIDRALDAVFQEYDEAALVDRAIEKKIRAQGTPADRRDVKRIFDHLVRLGFEYDLIMRRIREVRRKASIEIAGNEQADSEGVD